jgi:hypothetical protein
MTAKTPERTPAKMPRKRKLSDKEQYERFRQAARELDTDESEEAFARVIRKIVPSKNPP